GRGVVRARRERRRAARLARGAVVRRTVALQLSRLETRLHVRDARRALARVAGARIAAAHCFTRNAPAARLLRRAIHPRASMLAAIRQAARALRATSARDA